MKNKSGDQNSANNSLAHPEEMPDKETLQATTRSDNIEHVLNRPWNPHIWI